MGCVSRCHFDLIWGRHYDRTDVKDITKQTSFRIFEGRTYVLCLKRVKKGPAFFRAIVFSVGVTAVFL